jgi:hypothetical protein
MSLAETAYRAHPWRVHTIAHDFHLEDLWALRLPGHAPSDVREVLERFWSVFKALGNGSLVRARLRIGKALGWDDHDFALPIPGCTEKSLAERIDAQDRAKNLARPDAPSPVASPQVKTVYVFRDEALYEFSNDTIHGLIHIATADGAATLAVYVKTRGVMSRLYMAAIWPARHLVIYPALLRRLERAWTSAPERVAT